MKIKMLTNASICQHWLKAGVVYDLLPDVAKLYLDQKLAVPAPASAKAEKLGHADVEDTK